MREEYGAIRYRLFDLSEPVFIEVVIPKFDENKDIII